MRVLPWILGCTAMLAFASMASADLIGYWSFNGLTAASGEIPNSNWNQRVYLPEVGGGEFALDADWYSDPLLGTGWGISNSTGTSVNVVAGYLNGRALAIGGARAFDPAIPGYPSTGPLANNGKSATLSFRTLGFVDPIVTLAARQSSSSAFNSIQASWSTDNVTFTPFAMSSTLSSSFAQQTFDLSTVPEVDGQPLVYVKFTFDGATNPSSMVRIDNIQINATGLPVAPGDYNRDGTVDAADYVVWRDQSGAPDSVLPVGSTTDNSGFVDEGDYLTWQAAFGSAGSVGLASLAWSPVPEPTSSAICLGVLLCCGVRRRS